MSDYWKDNNIKKPQQVVVCAANKYGDLIICGARHHDKVMIPLIIALGLERYETSHDSQGFIDQFGDFLTRKEAMKVAKASGQKISLKGCGGSETILYSEGLY